MIVDGPRWSSCASPEAITPRLTLTEIREQALQTRS